MRKSSSIAANLRDTHAGRLRISRDFAQRPQHLGEITRYQVLECSLRHHGYAQRLVKPHHACPWHHWMGWRSGLPSLTHQSDPQMRSGVRRCSCAGRAPKRGRDTTRQPGAHAANGGAHPNEIVEGEQKCGEVRSTRYSLFLGATTGRKAYEQATTRTAGAPASMATFSASRT